MESPLSAGGLRRSTPGHSLHPEPDIGLLSPQTSSLEPGVSAEPDGLEILLDLARSGQVDPWNLDIVQVADQYLRAVADLQISDLKVTGRTLLYLAILLRMKSDRLAGMDFLGLDPEPEEAFEAAVFEENDGVRARSSRMVVFRSLDEVLKRRTSTKEPRIRHVTLDELVVELKRYEELERKRGLRERLEKADERRMADYSQFTADDIEDLAHEEFPERTILELQELLRRLFEGHSSVSITELSRIGHIDRISAFLALLFLTARGEVDLDQPEFYGELYACPTTDKPASVKKVEEASL